MFDRIVIKFLIVFCPSLKNRVFFGHRMPVLIFYYRNASCWRVCEILRVSYTKEHICSFLCCHYSCLHLLIYIATVSTVHVITYLIIEFSIVAIKFYIILICRCFKRSSFIGRSTMTFVIHGCFFLICFPIVCVSESMIMSSIFL